MKRGRRESSATLAATGGLFTIAIVGRPNVGKSTLFNRLVGGRESLVDDTPGVTRDRIYGKSEWLGKRFAVIDTGGFDPNVKEGIWREMRDQVRLAIEEADAIICLLDGTAGITAIDREVSDYLRKNATVPVFYTINKIDTAKREGLLSDFYELGVDKIYPVSAEHSRGVDDLLDDLFELIPPPEEGVGEIVEAVTVAVVGKPNAGKSTLINRMLGEERLLTHDVPGTTRDAVDTILKTDAKIYRFIDTAGIRRKSKVSHRIEKFSVIKALQAIDRCDVAILVIDAVEGLTDQDSRVAGYAIDRGKALCILLNKWDLVVKETMTFDHMVKDMKEKLSHADFAPVLSISAKSGMRTERILKMIDAVDAEHQKRVGTHELNTVFETAVAKHKPPVAKNRIIKFYYASQIGVRPPRFAAVTNRPDDVPVFYERYLLNQIREHFGFEGTPIKLFFRERKGRDKH